MATQLAPLLITLIFAAYITTGTTADTCESLLDLLQKLSTTPGGTTCGWTPVENVAGCLQKPAECDNIATAGIANDVLGRRASGLLAEPEYQGACGNCWAFASAHTFSDRLRLFGSNDHTNLVASAEDVTTCITQLDSDLVGPDSELDTPNYRIPNGCCGGVLYAGFYYFVIEGAVTRECKPNSLARNDKEQTPRLTCTNTCTCGGTMPGPFDRRDLRLQGIRAAAAEAEIIDELQNGPVLVGMEVPDDIFLYGCGIFCHTKGNISNGHAVEIVDYGTENGINYWVVKNSWGSTFGENGYFRIRRGEPYFLSGDLALAPVISETTDTVDMNDPFLSCAPEVIDTSDEFVTDAAEYVVETVASEIECQWKRAGAGSGTVTATVESIMAATSQSVAGILFGLTIDAAVSGCDDEAIITADVFLHLNGTLELMDFQYFPDGQPGGGVSSYGNAGIGLLIVLCMLAFI